MAETARGAAFDDPRFPPVTREEAPELEVSLSILSRLEPIQPSDVEIGRHGLLITSSWHRGLLLAASSGRAQLGSHHLPRTNLPESRPAAECVAARRQDRGFHRRGIFGSGCKAGDPLDCLVETEKTRGSLRFPGPKRLGLLLKAFTAGLAPRRHRGEHLPARKRACRSRSSASCSESQFLRLRAAADPPRGSPALSIW